MKKTCSVTRVSVLVVSFVACMMPMTANAARPGQLLETKADYCWDINNWSLEIDGTLQLRFTDLGGNHYLCSGAYTVYAGGELLGKFPAYGNAELVDGEIYLTLSLAGQRNGVIGTDTNKARLDPTSLNGPFDHIGVYADPNSDGAIAEVSNGNLTSAACQ